MPFTSAREVSQASAVGHGLQLAEEAALSPQELRSNFFFFATNFAINHGVVTTPLVLASSALAGNTGYIGNALLYLFTMMVSLLLGAPVTAALGLRGGTIFGMLTYVVYATCFAVAVFIGREGKDHLSAQAASVQAVIFCIGSVCGGVAAGVLWTAQGSYFARTVDLIHAQEGGDRSALTSTLAARFGVLYLGCELVAKLSWTLLEYIKIKGWLVAVIFTIVGAVPVLLQFKALALNSTGPRTAVLAKVKAAASLWSDPVLWMLAGINLTFGFTAAFMNGYVNANYASKLGNYVVPMLTALTALTAGIFSHVFGWISTQTGKGPVVVVGCLSFFSIPFCFLALKCCNDWGWAIVVLYVLQGSGRAVYESTNKGIFSDLFAENAPGAFANQMLQGTGAFALCFFLSSSLTDLALSYIAIVLAVLTPFGYFGAVALRQSQSRKERQPLVA